jgi:SAM-dependent methyltransferase
VTCTRTIPTAAAYDAAAAGYDVLTAGYAYEPWIGAIEELALDHGLLGRRMLDVACGTGKSFLPFLARGYDVTACDASVEMARLAREKAAGRVRVEVADIRQLPIYGAFDLVTCLGDVINHLASADDVRLALTCMRQNLREGGLLVFDVNGLAAYRDVPPVVEEHGRTVVVWRVEPAHMSEPGGRAQVLMETFTQQEHGSWQRATARWPHHHYPPAEIEQLLEDAQLEVVAVRGQGTGGVLLRETDEHVLPKLLFVSEPKGGAMTFRP